ncbi:GpU protein [Pseudomonas sp. OV226]|jgi:phage protein U|nr:phage tail protein [Pseudomonas sp. OV226]PWK28094.1 GpU protein [Pseudomonas sp. OV226]
MIGIERNTGVTVDDWPQFVQRATRALTTPLTVTGKAMYAVAMDRLDELRALQALRLPLPLIDGIGRNWGLWRIDNVTETQTFVIDDGTAMLINWSIELKEFANA